MKRRTMEEIKQVLDEQTARSAWGRGVIEYAWMLWDNVEQYFNWYGLNPAYVPSDSELERCLLNGAPSWKDYSWGGCAFIHDSDIARTLCTATELKRTDNGRKKPNSREQWLDVQARALYQAAALIHEIARGCSYDS